MDMSLSDFRRRNLVDIRILRRRYPLHERHGSAPTSLAVRAPPSGLMSVAASLNPPGPEHVTSRPEHVTSSPSASKPAQVTDRIPSTMDFSKFRDSGELSDVTISVDGRDFNLHKFPLYTRSDFFRVLARSDSGKVVLDEFPGGAETFEMVANYCYNKRIDVNKDNICNLRCAAEFLQMCSPGNLSECADRYLLDILTTAKLSRDMAVITELILKCRPLGAIAEQAGIIERCLHGIVDCWLLSSKWTSRLPSDRIVTDSSNFKRLCKLPLGWFKQLFMAAKEKNVRPTVLVKMVQMYIADKIKKKEQKEEIPETSNEEKNPEAADKAGADQEEEQTAKDATQNEDTNKPKLIEDAAKTSSDEHDEGARETAEEKINEGDTKEEADDDDDDTETVDLRVVMDTLLLELPDNTPLTETFSPQWAAAMLRVADELHCQCRGLLLKIVSKLLYRFTSADLSEIPPDLLQEVVQEASKDPVQVDPDTVCGVIDGYLLELADKDKLNVDTFNNLARSVPKEHRQNHDMLFKVLEKLLKSDTTNITDPEKEAMLESVDFRLLSEAALQNAYDSKLVPDPYVTRASLALCARLRGELETARDIIRAQEEELDRFGLSGGRASSWLRGVESDFGLVTSSVEPEARHSEYHSEEPPLSRLEEDLDGDYFKYSPPGHDPILEKALGGRYFDDPFDLDSCYPWYHQHTRSSERSYYDDKDYGRGSGVNYRQSYEPLSRRSTQYRSAKW